MILAIVVILITVCGIYLLNCKCNKCTDNSSDLLFHKSMVKKLEGDERVGDEDGDMKKESETVDNKSMRNDTLWDREVLGIFEENGEENGEEKSSDIKKEVDHKTEDGVKKELMDLLKRIDSQIISH